MVMEMYKATGANVLLASNSPRRRELLHMLIPDFGVAVSRDVDETYPPDMPPEQVAPYLSRLKADAYHEDLTTGEIIITADTIVINDGKILGKPHSEQEAMDMLRSLMGHTHTVITGVTLTSEKATETFSEQTQVEFASLTDAEIQTYVHNFHPLDKAGAYGIQVWIGCAGIRGINGCFYNVMGLPLHALYHHLKNFPY